MRDAAANPYRAYRGYVGIIFLLFFLSGFSGLVYEVIWSRLLIYLFGATIYAVSTVLAAFMGGLALGSFVFGRIADRVKNNLRLYAILELGIGLSALLLPVFLTLLNPIYTLVYQNLSASFLGLSLIRFALTFLVLLVPTTLMGATLPVLSRFLVRELNTLGLRVGALYSLNTLGAVAGCFFSGFYLIAYLGIRGTTFLAAAINVLVFLVALILSQKWTASPEQVKLASDTPSSADKPALASQQARPLDTTLKKKAQFYPGFIIWAVLISYSISGFVALAYQVAWSRALIFSFDLLKNTTYAFSAMLTVFLAGLAIGSWLAARIVDRQHDPLRLFALIEILIGLTGFLSFFIIYYKAGVINPFPYLDEAGENIIWWGAVLNIFTKTSCAIFIPTFLMGMAFPVAAKICVDNIHRVGFGVGRLYSANTVGAILGAFTAGFFIIPGLGLAKGMAMLAVINVLIGLVLLLSNPHLTYSLKASFALLVVLIVCVIFLRLPAEAKFQTLSPAERLIFYKEGRLATVSVVENDLGNRTLYVDNVGVAGTDPILLTDQKSLAHVPMLLLKSPRSALTVGFGSGGASWSYTRYPELDRIDCIEICETVMDAAPYLLESNKGILSINDPRYHIVIDDVRSYLRFTSQQYDIIATDCTDLRYKTNANLYDFEYFTLCKQRLSDDGMVVVWAPLAGLSDEALKVTLRTFYHVFSHMSVWYMNNEPTHYILLIGTKKPLRIDYELIREKLTDPGINKDIAEVNLNDVEKLLSCYITDQRALDQFLRGKVVNSENYPYLEFESPKYGYSEQPMFDNLSFLMSLRQPILPWLDNISDEGKLRLERFFDAVPDIITGHFHYRRLELLDACRSYLRALKKNPEDEGVKALLEFRTLRRRVKAYPQETWSRLRLGQILYLQQKYDEAVEWLKSVAEKGLPLDIDKQWEQQVRQELFEAHLYLGKCYIELKKPDKARPYLQQALRLKTQDPETLKLLQTVLDTLKAEK